jgi:hypothetical protein
VDNYKLSDRMLNVQQMHRNKRMKTVIELLLEQDKKTCQWWVSEMDKIIASPPPCFGEYDTPCSELDCEEFPCTYMAWQRFKKEWEAKQ